MYLTALAFILLSRNIQCDYFRICLFLLRGNKLYFLWSISTWLSSETALIWISDYITVPGGSDGPSGVLICSENYVTYKNLGDQPDIRCPIPRRRVSWEFDEIKNALSLFIKGIFIIALVNFPLNINSKWLHEKKYLL